MELSPMRPSPIDKLAEEIQAERAQIEAQDRDLNIKKIRLAIKELYVIFEDGQPIPFDNPPIDALALGLKDLLHICENTKGKASIVSDFSQGGFVKAYSQGIDAHGGSYELELSDDSDIVNDIHD